MNIRIEVIPREQMRPKVDGADWFFDDKGDLQVRVCPMSDWRREMLLAVHEVVEALICKHSGVAQSQVDKFDQQYDRTHDNDCEAGDDPESPYRWEHCIATAVERMLCAAFGESWKEYDDELKKTYPGPSKRSP